MIFWLISGALALVVTALLLATLRAGRAAAAMSASESDVAVYKDQLREVERDVARGVLSETEAEAVRVEVSRRLLEADRRGGSADKVAPGRALPAAIVIVAAVLAGSLALYSRLGAPGLGDLPMAERLAALNALRANRIGQAEAESRAAAAGVFPEVPPPSPEFDKLMTDLRAAIETRPDDPRGLALLAENEARLGNYAAARAAQERLVAVKGEAATPDDRLALLDIMVYATAGYVSPEAETVINAVLTAEPENGAALYYVGLLELQAGRPDRAFPVWRRLLETSDPAAPWVPVIRSQISGIAAAAGIDYAPPETRGPSASDMAAASEMSEEDRTAMIRGMVDGLAARLATDGGPPADWAQLITALGVLGETARAAEIADEARQVFAGNADALAQIDAARARAGLPE